MVTTAGIERALNGICSELKDISSELHWIRLDFDAIKEEMYKGNSVSVDTNNDIDDGK